MKRVIFIRSCPVLAFLVCISVNAYSQVPFECSDNFYQVFSTEGQLISYDLKTNTSVIAPNDAGSKANAFGYRNEDNLAYGIYLDTASLAQMGSDGTTNNLGVIPGFPVGNTAAGDFFKDGLLYVIYNSQLNTIYAIDVDTVTIVDIIVIPGPQFFVSDMAYNPVDGLFYGVSQNFLNQTDVPPGNLVTIDPVNATLNVIGPIGVPDPNNIAFGSMWTDGSGRVYGSDRITTNFYVFDTLTGAGTVLGQSQGGIPVDGFSCNANLGPLAVATPTLSQWGLIAMAAILGIVGFFILTRRKIAA